LPSNPPLATTLLVDHTQTSYVRSQQSARHDTGSWENQQREKLRPTIDHGDRPRLWDDSFSPYDGCIKTIRALGAGSMAE